jgi:membrane protease subunit HflK
MREFRGLFARSRRCSYNRDRSGNQESKTLKMPWTNQGGGNGDDSGSPVRGPWGGAPQRGGGLRPPDFEQILKQLRDRVASFLPRGLGRSGLVLIAGAVVFLWLASGIYVVQPSEQGIVLLFGKVVANTGPGLNYRLPWPIEVLYKPNVQTINQTTVGYHSNTESSDENQSGDIPDESLMLTGDENIVDVNFTVNWRIKDAAAYLFNVDNGRNNDTIKAVAESAMREVVGQNQIEPIMTSNREVIQIAVRDLMQRTLDSYDAGVFVTGVQMQKVEPPEDVRGAYLDVQKALADQDRMRNEAEAYANKIIPQARGRAAHIVQDAAAYRQQAIANATGEAKRFLAVLAEYRKAPEVTRRRMYLETMTSVLGPMNKVIVDDSAKGVIPYFQLPNMLRPQPPAGQKTAPSPLLTNPDQAPQQPDAGAGAQ